MDTVLDTSAYGLLVLEAIIRPVVSGSEMNYKTKVLLPHAYVTLSYI